MIPISLLRPSRYLNRVKSSLSLLKTLKNPSLSRALVVERTAASRISSSSSRKLSTEAVNGIPVVTAKPIHYRPPMLIRAAIVGSSVGLATPLFAVGGVVRVWYSYLPQSELGKVAKYVIGVLLGTGGVGLVYNYVIPFLQYNADFILPFAVSNALVASMWYMAGEMWLGLDVMLSGISEATLLSRNMAPVMAAFLTRLVGSAPIAGAVIGALTAVTAPFCWPLFLKLCWNKDLFTLLLKDDPYWIIDLYNWIAIPVGVPVGMLAGITLQLLLKPVIAGTPGVPWVNRSLPVLVGILGSSVIYYTFFRSFSTDFLWELRLNHATGNRVSYNPRTLQLQHDGGKAADDALMKREVMKRINGVRSVFRFQGEITREPRRLTSKEEVTVNNLDDRAKLFKIVDLVVRVKYLQLQLRNSNKNAKIFHKKSELQDDLAAATRSFDTLLGVGEGNLDSLLAWVERGLVAKQVEDRFERSPDYSGSSQMLSESVARINRIAEQCKDTEIAESLKFLALNFDIMAEEFKSKLGFEVAPIGSEEERKVIADYKTEGALETVTRTMKIFVVAGFMGACVSVLATYLISK